MKSMLTMLFRPATGRINLPWLKGQAWTVMELTNSNDTIRESNWKLKISIPNKQMFDSLKEEICLE